MNMSKDTNPGIIVGLKLDIGFSTQESYHQLYGNRKILEYLAELGFTVIETPIGLEIEKKVLMEHVICCLNAALMAVLSLRFPPQNSWMPGEFIA